MYFCLAGFLFLFFTQTHWQQAKTLSFLSHLMSLQLRKREREREKWDSFFELNFFSPTATVNILCTACTFFHRSNLFRFTRTTIVKLCLFFYVSGKFSIFNLFYIVCDCVEFLLLVVVVHKERFAISIFVQHSV